MDGIQAYAGATRPHPQSTPVFSAAPSAAKSPADYIRALRRRFWLVLAIGVPLSILGGIWTVRQPNVYMAKTQILIEPPQFDPYLSTLVSQQVGPRDNDGSETYVPNRIAMLRSRSLADRVVNDPSLTQGSIPPDDAADQLVASLQTRQVTGTNQYTVSLEGTDPARTQKQLRLLLEAFQDQANNEINSKIEGSKSWAQESLKQLYKELETLQNKVYAMLKNSSTIGPGGKNIIQMQYETLSTSIQHDNSRLGELEQQAWLAQSFPSLKGQGGPSSVEGSISELELMREELTGKLQALKRRIKYFDLDPSVRFQADKLKLVMDRLEKLRKLTAPSGEAGVDPYEALVQSKRAELQRKEDAAKALLVELQDSMPKHQQFLDLLNEQEHTLKRISAMSTKIWEFEAVSKSRKEPIRLLSPVAEPTVPVRPKRTLNMAIALFFSFGLGIGLVCVLEHFDHSVKEPEQLITGLSLPLFGVIPRIRRTASLHRGGHLWTPGAPDSIEADAYRNLRASLLGVSDKRGPMVTLLVTSAKAGEGKSTTALNLAATCARAGERTLLMDVDLRRPSLAGVFQDDDEFGFGLVDVLRGDLPWQRTVVRTDIPNLDFLPTGDTRDVPIEILGTLELRQLIIGLSNHYDRVILDGPAILGLADCRMLGRVVDSALLVVRSGTQQMRPLQHAKAMLEQSHVVISGVIFNGLYEDLKNWSSYGPETPYGYTGSGSGRNGSAGNGLEGPSDKNRALPLADTLQS